MLSLRIDGNRKTRMNSYETDVVKHSCMRVGKACLTNSHEIDAAKQLRERRKLELILMKLMLLSTHESEEGLELPLIKFMMSSTYNGSKS